MSVVQMNVKTEIRKEVQCEFCERKFATDKALSGHLGRHKDVMYMCTETDCGLAFSSGKEYNLHKSIHRTDLKCDVCHKIFFRKSALKTHTEEIHLKKRNFECAKCGKSFYRKHDYTMHLNSHKGLRKFPCKFCDKSFGHVSNLNRHQRLHTNEKPYVCSECGARFTQSSTLVAHKQQHDKTLLHQCDRCDKRFLRQSQLKRHMRSYHDLEVEPATDRQRHSRSKFYCSVCGITFLLKLELIRHTLQSHPEQKGNLKLKHDIRSFEGITSSNDVSTELKDSSAATNAELDGNSHIQIHSKVNPSPQLPSDTGQPLTDLHHNVADLHPNVADLQSNVADLQSNVARLPPNVSQLESSAADARAVETILPDNAMAHQGALNEMKVVVGEPGSMSTVLLDGTSTENLVQCSGLVTLTYPTSDENQENILLAPVLVPGSKEYPVPGSLAHPPAVLAEAHCPPLLQQVEAVHVSQLHPHHTQLAGVVHLDQQQQLTQVGNLQTNSIIGSVEVFTSHNQQLGKAVANQQQLSETVHVAEVKQQQQQLGTDVQISGFQHQLGCEVKLSGIEHQQLSEGFQISDLQHHQQLAGDIQMSGLQHPQLGSDVQVSHLRHPQLGGDVQVSDLRHPQLGCEVQMSDIHQHQPLLKDKEQLESTVVVTNLVNEVDQVCYISVDHVTHPVEQTNTVPGYISEPITALEEAEFDTIIYYEEKEESSSDECDDDGDDVIEGNEGDGEVEADANPPVHRVPVIVPLPVSRGHPPSDSRPLEVDKSKVQESTSASTKKTSTKSGNQGEEYPTRREVKNNIKEILATYTKQMDNKEDTEVDNEHLDAEDIHDLKTRDEQSPKEPASETQEAGTGSGTCGVPDVERYLSSIGKSFKLPKKFRCEICDKMFATHSSLKFHRGKHDANKKLFQCDICNQSFSWKTTLERHKKNCHGEPDYVSCDQCPKQFKAVSILKDHIRRDHNKEKSFECMVCPRLFYKMSDLKVHMRVHSKVRPYSCELCQKTFSHNSHLHRHMRTHDKKIISYDCQYCSRSFRNEKGLVKHSSVHAANQESDIVNLLSSLGQPD